MSYCLGEVGPNAQHAFYQLLHQGSFSVTCDFIAPIHRYNADHFTYADSAEALVEQHHLALSNCLAQSRLLAFGNQALNTAELETCQFTNSMKVISQAQHCYFKSLTLIV